MIDRIIISFPDDKHMDNEYRMEIYRAFKLICDNIDCNGIYCMAVNRK